MLDALPLADEPRAGDRAILPCASPAPIGLAAVEVLGNCFETLKRLGLEPPIGELLDPIGEPAFEEATVLRIAHAYQQLTDWHRREIS